MEYGAPLSGGKGLVKGVPSERRGPPFGGLGGLAPARGLFPQGCAPHSLFGLAQKENAPRPVEEKKALRRVGLRKRRPPAAGGGRLALPCRSQGRKRPALGETFGPGRSGIHPASLFAAAGRWSMKVAAWVNATVSTTARGARSEAERAEGGTSGTLVTEILGAPQRETVKEKLVKCVLATRRPGHHPPRDGSIDLAEDPSVPEGQPKSTLAPIVARRATAPKRA